MTELPPLPSNFIVYDHDNPSPYFPPEKVVYIESFTTDFSDEEVKQIRAMERFALNLNTGGVGGDEIPGIREKPTEMYLYFKRFSDASWRADVKALMDSIPDSFEDKGRCLVDMSRATLPNGDRYYPMTLLGDHEEWKRHLQQAATVCRTKLAHLIHWPDDGKVVDVAYRLEAA
ncbi:hypothetical protein [Lichenifustis flavocetrariae]|uniref:Uncharacterized protein n=1 Tax=Lichenifustis flavocetrariae TaxID=2949735 RepID=A0AA41Z216_9HYPH|nr:hypothetical protein [Lichenifustis flavocetrariae]MCW6511413.1 hypothetical protein [Lichenifustis flavocetrariae]